MHLLFISQEIHTPAGTNDMWGFSEEEFLERMKESTKATISHFAFHISYIHRLKNMSVDCDCAGCEGEPVVTLDIGILAVNNAGIDMRYSLPGGGGKAMIERVESRHGFRQLSYMKEMGMINIF